MLRDGRWGVGEGARVVHAGVGDGGQRRELARVAKGRQVGRSCVVGTYCSRLSSGSYFLSSSFISAQIGLFFSISIEYNFPAPILAFVRLCWGWCTGTTQRDGMGREEGGGFRMGNTQASSRVLSWAVTASSAVAPGLSADALGSSASKLS